MKRFLKQLIPSMLINYYTSFNSKDSNPDIWQGNYKNWDEALNNCSGYDNAIILNSCKKALLQVKNGQAVYERDSVIFDKIQYAWPVLASLQNVALENDGNLCVLDFGGSMGSTYYQNKGFLNSLKSFQWCVVEQKHFVNCGKENFEDTELKFYYSIEECLANHKPHLLLLSGVLQYLPNPFEWIEKFITFKIPHVIIDRTGFVLNGDSILTIQHVPEEIYKADYPCWFFNEKTFINVFLSKYTVLAEFNDSFTPPIQLTGNRYYWKGFYLKRNNGK